MIAAGEECVEPVGGSDLSVHVIMLLRTELHLTGAVTWCKQEWRQVGGHKLIVRGVGSHNSTEYFGR